MLNSRGCVMLSLHCSESMCILYINIKEKITAPSRDGEFGRGE